MTSSTKTPPKVTYTNSGTDFSLLHELYDEAIPAFSSRLGQRYPNWIGGQPSTSGEVYKARSPIDSDIVLGEFYAATREDVNKAVAAARSAQRGWQAMGWEQRVVILRRIAEEIDRRKMELCAAAIYEVGKSRLEASAEIDETADLIRHYSAEMERNAGFAGEQKIGFQGEDVRSVQRPYGVFGVIAPFNFPFALVCGMMSAALVAGNAVILKPSPMAGLSASLIQECFATGGLPDGLLNILNGHDVTGRAIVENEGIDGIAFTGSNDVGMTILRHFASGPFAKPVLAEMGGKNPSYVSARANFADAVAGVRESAFGLQGQRCSANSVCFVERPIFEDFIEALSNRTAELSIGDVRERSTYMGAVINEAAARRWQGAVDSARQHGRIVRGGNRLTGGLFDRGAYVEPTIVTDLHDGHDLYQKEIFAPFIVVRPYDTLEEALKLGNSVRFGLAAGIYSQDQAEVDYFADNVEAGVLYANRALGATTGAWPGVQSFCGWKGSGMTGKGGLGNWYVPQFMREQGRTFMPIQRLG